MLKRKFSKLFFMFGVIFLSTGLFGCVNEKVQERESKDVVRFSISHFTVAMNSVPGQPIALEFENATFICKTDAGSFSIHSEVKETTVNSGEEIYYCPIYQENESVRTITEDSYIDILIYVNSEIIGYSVIKINYEDNQTYTPEVLVSNTFVDKQGAFTNVDEDYATNRISDYHR